MSEPKVVAAVDSSVAGNPVLVTARALARLLGVRVEGVSVVGDGASAPQHEAAAVGVPLRVVSGPVVPRLIEADRAEDTVALVIGARSSPTSAHALGSTALAVVTASTKPVVVVPPAGRIAPRITRVLAPVEAISASLEPQEVIELSPDANLEVVALDVGSDGLADAEVLRRYTRAGLGSVRVEIRDGAAEDLVPAVADERDCDLIALAWANELTSRRASVVRAALERSPLPIMLIPARLEDAGRPDLIRQGAAR